MPRIIKINSLPVLLLVPKVLVAIVLCKDGWTVAEHFVKISLALKQNWQDPRTAILIEAEVMLITAKC